VHWAPLLSFPRYIDNPRLFRHIVDLDEYSVSVLVFRDPDGIQLELVAPLN
jgi:hypothetical protein